MGYNVLMLDTDSYFYTDPYAYLKKPPFSEISYMSLPDGGLMVRAGSAEAGMCWQPGRLQLPNRCYCCCLLQASLLDLLSLPPVQVNGGASYIHNFQPGGPAAYTIASVVSG